MRIDARQQIDIAFAIVATTDAHYDDDVLSMQIMGKGGVGDAWWHFPRHRHCHCHVCLFCVCDPRFWLLSPSLPPNKIQCESSHNLFKNICHAESKSFEVTETSLIIYGSSSPTHLTSIHIFCCMNGGRSTPVFVVQDMKRLV